MNETTNDKAIEELRETLQSLSDSDLLKVGYELRVTKESDHIKEWSMFLLDWLDSNRIINDYETGTSDSAPAIAMAHTAAVLLRTSLEGQARLEMQAQDESTQWAMKLADSMSDVASNLVSDAEQMITLMSHYQACLAGRRGGIAYQDQEGNAIVYQDNTTEK